MINNMLTVLFGSITKGRLMRLPYLGYCLFLVLSAIGLGVIIVLAIGAGEHIIGGDLLQAQDKLREWFTVPFLMIFGLSLMLLVYAGVNITVKRIRDIGLPGWWVMLAIIILGSIVSFTISKSASSGLYNLIWILLLLIPSNTLSRENTEDK